MLITTKRTAIKTASMLLMVLILITVAEMTLRLFSIVELDSDVRRDDAIGFRMRPNLTLIRPSGVATHCNSDGFNDREFDDAQFGAQTKKILFVGDSFTFGIYSHEDVFPHLVEQGLQAGGLDAVSINVGVIGSGPKEYLRVLRHYGELMRPDIVVVTLFVGNDVTQSNRLLETGPWLGTVGTFPRLFSIGLSPEYYSVYRNARALSRIMLPRIDSQNAFLPDNWWRLSIERQALNIYAKHPPSFIRKSHTGLKSILGQIQKEAERLDSQLLIVLAPAEIQINARLLSAVVDYYALDPLDYAMDRPQQILSHTMEEIGIPHLDLLPTFRKANQSGRMYQEGDTHWNKAGNRLAAGSITEALRVGSRTQ